MLIQDADLELDPQEYGGLLAPILAGRRRRRLRLAVPASRPPASRCGRASATALLTWLTNVLFGARLTDMETAYKVFRRESLDGIRLRCVGFDFEPELTAKFLRAGRRIVEVPVRYNPRRVDEGKKIRWTDGVDAVYALIKCRLARR